MNTTRTPDELQVIKWTAEHFRKGCLLGDIARQELNEITDDEVTMMECTYEGYCLAGGT